MLQKRFFLLAIITIGLIFIPASDSYAAKRKKGTDCHAKLQQIITKFNKHHYYSAKTQLEEIMLDCGGSESYDTMLYYSGQSSFLQKKYEEAKPDFTRLNRDYPSSPWNEEVMFKVGACGYFLSSPPERDQATTREAITELTTFIETYPQSPFADSARIYVRKCREKLAKKEFLAAQFYETIGQYESAVVYHKNFLESFKESELLGEARFNLAADLIKLNRIEEAKSALNDLMAGNPPKALADKAAAMLKKIENL
jgi:outer membrane protein assembly factor BamD